MNFTRFIAQGEGRRLWKSDSDHPLASLELRNAYLQILREAAITGVKTSTQLPLITLLHPGLGRNGRFGEGVVIDYQGYLLASSRSQIRLGHVLTQGLERIFLHHPLLQKVRKNQIEICGTCSHRRRCGGDRNAAYAESGNYLGHDPGCWKGLIDTN